jgi:hypothetical protein
MTKKTDDAVTAYLRKIGSRGGSAGTGEAKRRGDTDYYRRIARKRRAKKGGK